MAPLRNLLLFAIATATSFALNSRDDDNAQKAMVLGDSCQHPAYKTHILSKSPLVIYLSDFLTPEERLHLTEITKNTFTHSSVADETGAQGHRQTRTSQSTNVPRDHVVRCIEQRAQHFQGFDTSSAQLEPIQLVKYAQGEHYHFHTDWYTNPTHATSRVGGNRVSSFFAYVAQAENITGGGTNFPVLDAPLDERWCEWVDCDTPWEEGVTFRPVLGNAVFWQNLYDDGVGDQRTLHAGLPVTSGWKIGMNIWTRQGEMGEDIRGLDV